MSTRPYSIDLRQKVIEYIESGRSQKSASGVFNLNPSTVSRWWLRYKRQGHYKAKVRVGKKAKVTELELKRYIDANPNFKTSQMGKHFGMSSVGALYWLRKLGYSYKKKPLGTWKQMKKKEEPTKSQ